MYLGYFPLINSLNWQIHIIWNNTYLMFIWDLFFTHAETLKKKKSSNRYRKIVKRSWRKYVLTRWTKTSDRTDRIIDPFPGMDEKTSCSVLSRKGQEYGTGCLTKEARFLILYSDSQLWLPILKTSAARRLKINGKLLLKFLNEMDEKTSCSVLSRKGTGVWNRVFNKRGKNFKRYIFVRRYSSN